MKPTELLITTTPYDWSSSTAKAKIVDASGVRRFVKATCTSGEEGAAMNLAFRVLVGDATQRRQAGDLIKLARHGMHRWRATLKAGGAL